MTTLTATSPPRPGRTTPRPVRHHPCLGQEEGRPGPVRADDWLIDTLIAQAFASLQASPGARAYYDKQRARGSNYNAALRQLANRLVGILHGCLKTGTLYDEATAWPHRAESPEKAAA